MITNNCAALSGGAVLSDLSRQGTNENHYLSIGVFSDSVVQPLIDETEKLI